MQQAVHSGAQSGRNWDAVQFGGSADHKSGVSQVVKSSALQ